MIKDSRTSEIQSKVSMNTTSKYQDQIACTKRSSITMILCDGKTGEIQEERLFQEGNYVG